MDGSVTLLFQVDMEKSCLEFVFFQDLTNQAPGLAGGHLQPRPRSLRKEALVRGIGPQGKTKQTFSTFQELFLIILKSKINSN